MVFRISTSLSQPGYSRLVKIFVKIFRLFSSLMEEVCHFASPILTLSKILSSATNLVTDTDSPYSLSRHASDSLAPHI